MITPYYIYTRAGGEKEGKERHVFPRQGKMFFRTGEKYFAGRGNKKKREG